MRAYILVGKTAVPVDWLSGAMWLERHIVNRHVGDVRLLDMIRVSTCFQVYDMNWDPEGPPLLYESMAFWDGEGGYEQERCSTWVQAEAMHEQMCREVVRPAAVWDYIKRLWEGYWNQAKEDWRIAWNELRNIEPTETEQMLRRLRERIDERRYQ